MATKPQAATRLSPSDALKTRQTRHDKENTLPGRLYNNVFRPCIHTAGMGGAALVACQIGHTFVPPLIAPLLTSTLAAGIENLAGDAALISYNPYVTSGIGALFALAGYGIWYRTMGCRLSYTLKGLAFAAAAASFAGTTAYDWKEHSEHYQQVSAFYNGMNPEERENQTIMARTSRESLYDWLKRMCTTPSP